MKKLAIISSHPVQYNAPLFRKLAERNAVELKVFYTWSQTKEGTFYDPYFKKDLKWDIPLLDGYEFEFIENIASKPGSHHFYGIVNQNLIEKIDAYNPHAILVYGWSFQSHLKAIRYYKGKKRILFRGDSTLLDEQDGFSFKKIVRRFFLKWVYSHVDKALYVGKKNKEYFIKHGLAENQLVYAPHAVDNSRFGNNSKEMEQQAMAEREKLNISVENLLLLYAGKFEEKKDPETLIKAFRLFDNPNWRLLLTGNGQMEEELKKMAIGDDRIIFQGFKNQTEMPVLYRMSDVFILPSKGPGETWGLAVNEAMACGRCAIVSNKAGCAYDLIIEGETGYTFQSGNHHQLINILKSIGNKETLSKLGKQASGKVVNFGYEHVCSAIEESV